MCSLCTVQLEGLQPRRELSVNQVAFFHHEREGTVRRGSPSAGECDFSHALLATHLSPYRYYLILYGIDNI